jgi:hypothetical protein
LTRPRLAVGILGADFVPEATKCQIVLRAEGSLVISFKVLLSSGKVMWQRLEFRRVGRPTSVLSKIALRAGALVKSFVKYYKLYSRITNRNMLFNC